MIGKEFSVYEIDEYGSVRVEQCWDEAGKGQCMNHFPGLSPNEFELVDK